MAQNAAFCSRLFVESRRCNPRSFAAWPALLQTLKSLDAEVSQLAPEQRPSLAADPRPAVLGQARPSAPGITPAASARLRAFPLAESLLDDSYWAAATQVRAALWQ